MTTSRNPGLARWDAGVRTALSGGGTGDAIACLHPDVVFNSPVVHTPYRGAAIAGGLLTAIFEVLEDFHYTDVLDQGDRAGLVFAASVGDRQLQGWDYLVFDDDGQITDFTVMIRPMSGLTAVAGAMKAKLGELGFDMTAGHPTGPALPP